jgi:hypothetical protein
MSDHLVRLVRSGTTLIDLQNFANNVLSNWQLATYDEKAICVEDTLTINPRGATNTLFFDNLVTFGRAMIDGNDNYYQFQHGLPYTPLFLQFRADGSSTTMQSEWFGAEPEAVNNWVSAALRNKLIPGLVVKFKRRPYWEETAVQSIVAGQSISNNGGSYDITGVRGDIPSPLTVTVRTATTNQDRVILAAKASGHGQTVSNFVNKYEAESYTTRYTTASSVADLTDANFSGSGAPQGQRWTVNTTSEVTLLTWDITSNASDQLGQYRVFVRCRDNRTSGFNVKIRVRAGIYTTGNAKQYGDYGAIAKYGDGTGVTGGSNASPGTTAIHLIDCGIITLPPVDTQGVAPSKMILELAATATSTSGSPTFDVDCIYLMPLYELPLRSGYVMARYPIELGNGAAPDAIITGADRVSRAYLDDAGTLQYVASEIRGSSLYAWNNKTVRLYVMTQRDSNLRHTQNLSHSVTITVTPRYRYPVRGS